jgi:hypothetical protein
MSKESEQTTRSGTIGLRSTFASIASSIWELVKSKQFWRLIIIYSVISLSVFSLLGLGFYLIVNGLLIVLLRLAAIYLPAKRLLAVITGLSEEESIVKQFTGPQWAKIFILLPALFWLGTSVFGFWLLLRNGFLAQNFIYLLFFR